MDYRDEKTILECMRNIRRNGPVDESVLTTLSICKYVNPDAFKKYENDLCIIMGLFFKKIRFDSLNSYTFPFLFHKSVIQEKFDSELTPTQADIRYIIKENESVLFSAPTSIGKSFVLRQIAIESAGNVIIMVPTRALLNEYAHDLRDDLIKSGRRDTNVLTFIEKVNLKHAKRNIYVLTPERCFDLFKNDLDVSLFVIDEAQIVDKANGVRSLNYRDVIQRIKRKYRRSKKIYAYPFVDNLDELSEPKNNDRIKKYLQRNVGQLFIEEKGEKYNVISSKGEELINDIEDPISRALDEEKRVLVYCEKTKIFNGEIFEIFKKYVSICEKKSGDNLSDEANDIIGKIEEKIGANPTTYHSQLIQNLRVGIAIHHAALPHEVRVLIEDFIKKGYAHLCFATSTLEQGVNLPFDLIYIRTKRFLTNPIDYKNIVGRAGRSTMDPVFDYGVIVVRNKKDLIDKMGERVIVDANGEPVRPRDSDKEIFEIYKDAIKNDTIDENTNLPSEILERISSEKVKGGFFEALHELFLNGAIKNSIDKESRVKIVNGFFTLYKAQMKSREPFQSEKHVFSETIKLMIQKLQRKKFSQIVAERYHEAQNRQWKDTTCFHKLPGKVTGKYNLFESMPNQAYYFDLIVYDTYQYIDLNYNLYLKDLLYGAAYKYLELAPEKENIASFMNLLKYGSSDRVEIMLFRYGFNDDEIDLVRECVDSIDEKEILFNDKVYKLEDALRQKCLFYKY